MKKSQGNTQWSSGQVWDTCEKMQLVERVRASDRAIINSQFNGLRPYTNEEVERYNIQYNVNWGEGKQILIPAINQLNNALIFKEKLFAAISQNGRPEKKQEYGNKFTTRANELLKTGLAGIRYMFLLKSRNASVALHGIGPILWPNGFRWRGRFVPLEDLLIPTDTFCDFSNLMFFGWNQYLTIGEFFDMVSEPTPGWDMKMVDKILEYAIKPDHSQSANYLTIQDQPEKRVEWLKQNRNMWDYDAATTIKMRTFYYKHYDTKEWCRCVQLRENYGGVPADKQQSFLYDNPEPFAENISQILHVQYGDNSLVAPLKYHSVRGLGVDLYGPVEANNRMRCEFQQHASFAMKTLLKMNNPIDRDRPKVLDMSQYSVVEDGVEFITAQDRYTIDPRLAEQALSQNKAIMGEASASYVKDVQSETTQPRTATESSILANEATEAVSNMLQAVYAQEEFLYQETIRRLCDTHSEDPEVKEFQRKCIADGIPKNLMISSNWKIKIERVLGGGNQTMAIQEASALLSNSQRYDPNSQRIILRNWTNTITRDPKMGELLVPDDPSASSPGAIAAEDIFGTLYDGIPLQPRQGIDRVPHVEAIIGMLGEKIRQVQQIDNMGTPQDLIGLQTIAQYATANLKILEQDPEQKQAVKMLGDELGKAMNEVKGMAQRQQQAAQAAQQPQPDPAVMAKAQSTTMLAQQRAQINETNAQQKAAHKQQAFEQDMAQKMEAHRLEMMRLMAETHADLVQGAVKTASDVHNQRVKTEASSGNGNGE